jgi:hypothetical protein
MSVQMRVQLIAIAHTTSVTFLGVIVVGVIGQVMIMIPIRIIIDVHLE